MEQEYGEQSAGTSLAARTVLPGEPFDAPSAEAVPAPRDVTPAPQEPPVWNYAPADTDDLPGRAAPRSFEPISYDPTYGNPDTVDPHHPPVNFTPTYATAESLATAEFDSLHQYGQLPVEEGFDAPLQYAVPDASAPPAYPAPTYDASAPSVYDPTAAAPSYDFNKPPAYDSGATAAPVAYPSGDVLPAADDIPMPPASHDLDTSPAYPAPEANWEATAEQPVALHEAFGGTPQQDTLAAPAPPADEPPTGEDDASQRKSHRAPNKALIALAAVVVLAGGGYFGYTQLSKSDSSTDTSSSNAPITPATPGKKAAPTTPAVAPTTPAVGRTTSGAYRFPSHLAGYPVRTGTSAAALNRQISSFSKTAYSPAMGAPSVSSYGTSAQASLVAISFHPAASRLNGAFGTLLAGARRPASGNTVIAFTSVPAGAAGGSMTCGSQTGASPISYCVWKGTSTVGMVYMQGQTPTPNTQALTRELRAYGEH